MRTTSLHRHGHTDRKGLHFIVFLVAMLAIGANSANAMAADLVPRDFRVSMAADKFNETRQYAVAYRLRPPRRLRAHHLELAIGSIGTTSRTHAFVSFGPVWRLPLVRGNDRWHVQLGFSPTLLSGSTISGRDLGGNFHFTSSVSLGALLGERRALSIALRIQHTSNGGIDSTNPGLDMVGLNISYDFDR